MVLSLMNACLRLLSHEAVSTSRHCGACGRPLTSAFRHLGNAAFKSRGKGSRWTVAGAAPSSGGNPDVMRKFQELQAKQHVDDFDELDDFDVDDSQQQGTEVLAGAEARLPKKDLPPPQNTRVRTSKYMTSAVSLDSCPKAKLPEFAVIGRSNVGKSSLINMLTQNKGLALVSKQPGKTKCINHFLINDSWWLVDLPGYGYAKSARDDRLKWNDFTKDYFLRRETLVMVLLLVDASIPPQPVDLECATWMLDSEVPFTLVFTKADKRKKGTPPAAENVNAFLELLSREAEALPECFVTSAAANEGRSDVLNYLASLRQVFAELYVPETSAFAKPGAAK